eukprot:5679137-Prymnesium_polylepis.1
MGEGLGHAPSEAPRLRRGLPSARSRLEGATSPQEGVWADPHCVSASSSLRRIDVSSKPGFWPSHAAGHAAAPQVSQPVLERSASTHTEP